ncbi:hypothetical protein TBLA_0E03400 [Henningerozyma blattae CBS 6284]|uniref:ATP synthase subunit K, mitochondrial n=1 Tax=Henningerozyma blattae (strain ATCC 34711 / CBS 6284 / DSM 70876 / NBRC 10599 / NRRL Y-10934 / UCD 77-7) TaxID=1071380 RepID=I2H4U2_HENB6|nr:hypothetical protein TBLA_0E03400 [Tetrapisispora blattae CBS 6284]CCH61394.1 hypothetical protein TBLA_0E03400 [Tetrapisispora blattae CBS 6284]
MAAYVIMGRTVPNHYLALGTLGTLSLFLIPNPFKSKKPLVPDLAKLCDSEKEQKFVSEYLAARAK